MQGQIWRVARLSAGDLEKRRPWALPTNFLRKCRLRFDEDPPPTLLLQEPGLRT
jgi:hypothetical protein